MSTYAHDKSNYRAALAARELSYDPDRQVGVVIAFDETILVEASNKPPLALQLSEEETIDFLSKNPDSKYFIIEHAERNAIALAHSQGVDIRGGTLYGTLFPCADCARAIVAAGISRIVVPKAEGGGLRDLRWKEHYHYANEIFEKAGITVDHPEDDA